MNINKFKTIYFAGGCFWGVEEYFRRIKGVENTIVGYANGKGDKPTYEDVCYKNTGFAEVVKIEYNPLEIKLSELLESFFKIINPISKNKQGNDIGTQYRSGVYYIDADDRAVIESVFLSEQQKYESKIATELKPLENFYSAEEYHQKYLVKNPGGYCHISFE